MEKNYSDINNNIAELKKLVQIFCEDRDWDQFHNPKELSIAISTEANELLQMFRFKTEKQMNDMLENDNKRIKIEEEISDVLYFILRFAQLYNIDLSSALNSKIEKNNINYPIESSKGNNKKYNEGE